MANKLYEETEIRAIAAAIREKSGSTATYKVSDMASAVREIPTGSTKNIQVSYGCSRVANTSTYTATAAKLTVEKTGTYRCACFAISTAPGGASAAYDVRFYVNGKYVGDQHHYTKMWNNDTPEEIAESGIQLNEGDTIEVRARTRTGASNYYTIVFGLTIEEE